MMDWDIVVAGPTGPLVLVQQSGGSFVPLDIGLTNLLDNPPWDPVNIETIRGLLDADRDGELDFALTHSDIVIGYANAGGTFTSDGGVSVASTGVSDYLAFADFDDVDRALMPPGGPPFRLAVSTDDFDGDGIPNVEEGVSDLDGNGFGADHDLDADGDDQWSGTPRPDAAVPAALSPPGSVDSRSRCSPSAAYGAAQPGSNQPSPACEGDPSRIGALAVVDPVQGDL